MSASPRTVQSTLGIRQLRAALLAVGLAIALVLVVAFGQLTATKSQASPAGGAAPAQFDHGWSSDPSNVRLDVTGPGGMYGTHPQ